MRNNLVICVAGTRGTGKTDFTKNLIFKQRGLFSKILVVDTFDSYVWRNLKTFLYPDNEAISIPVMKPSMIPRWKSGMYRTFSSDTAEIMTLIEDHVQNAMIVFEDATKYIGSRLTKEMRKFVLDSKQKNLDLVFIFHSLSAIPPDLVRVSDFITLFKTNEGHPSKEKYPFPSIPVAMDKIRASKDRYRNITIALN